MNSYRCSVEILISSVSCPGVWLRPQLGNVYLVIDIFGQRVCTASVQPIFPLKFGEIFYFEKIFFRCDHFSTVFDDLKGELIHITLEQINVEGWPVILATYCNNVSDFLFPQINILHSHSRSKRDLLLCPTRYFPGIIGPRFEFESHTSVAEVPRCYWNLLDNYEAALNEGRNGCVPYYSPKKVQIGENLISYLMEDRPPFVVRKVDSKLLSRTPSLFKEYGSKKAYCCRSPHRYSKCAACRMGFGSSLGSYRPSFKREAVLVGGGSGNRPVEDKFEKRVKTNIEPWKSKDDDIHRVQMQPPSPELLRAESPFSPPISRPVSPSPEIRETRDRLMRSPLFNRPTFRERFGGLPVNISHHQTTGPQSIMKQDQSQQTDYGFEKLEDRQHWTPPHTCSKSCYCSHNIFCQYRCSCPYCPTYWRARLHSPSRYHWQSFHNGLATIYDDIYHNSLHI